MAKTFYGYQRLKLNKWFEEQFLPSFQLGCQQISERQFRIFEKYLIEDSENWRSNNIEYWRGIVNGFCVTASRHSVWNGTLKNLKRFSMQHTMMKQFQTKNSTS